METGIDEDVTDCKVLYRVVYEDEDFKGVNDTGCGFTIYRVKIDSGKLN